MGSLQLPRRLIIRNCAYALDGGTIHLAATDEAGAEIGITLAQHAFVAQGEPGRAIPGRLYFAGQLVPIRSELEQRVLRLIACAEIQAPPPQSRPGQPMVVFGGDIKQLLSRTPEEACRAFIREIVEFVQSDKYLAFAASVEQAGASRDA